MDREAIISASEIVTGAGFYQHQYGVMFEAMVELFNEGKPVDLVTVSSLEQEARMPSEESFRKAVWKEKVDIYVAA